MSVNLAEILKKAKAIDKAALKFDSNPSVRGGGDTTGLSQTINMSEQQIPTEQLISEEQMVQRRKQLENGSDAYMRAAEKSKLPPEIKRAMMQNPIEQADYPGTFSVDEGFIREVNGGVAPNNGRQQMVETNSVSNNDIRKIIAEEIAKALPKVVEEYFDKRVINEDIQIKVGNTIFSGNLKPVPKKKKQ